MSKEIKIEADPMLNSMLTSQRTMNKSVSSILNMKKDIKGVELKDLHNLMLKKFLNLISYFISCSEVYE